MQKLDMHFSYSFLITHTLCTCSWTNLHLELPIWEYSRMSTHHTHLQHLLQVVIFTPYSYSTLLSSHFLYSNFFCKRQFAFFFSSIPLWVSEILSRGNATCSASILSRATICPPAKRHSSGVLLMGRWWSSFIFLC